MSLFIFFVPGGLKMEGWKTVLVLAPLCFSGFPATKLIPAITGPSVRTALLPPHLLRRVVPPGDDGCGSIAVPARPSSYRSMDMARFAGTVLAGLAVSRIHRTALYRRRA